MDRASTSPTWRVGPGSVSASALALSTILLATPAWAWHFAGDVRCDVDNSGTVTAVDTPLAGLKVRVTALVVNVGTTYDDTTDGNGYYFVSLPDFPNAYDAEIINLPGGYSVVSPAGGRWQNVQLSSTVVARDDIDFLVQGCGPVSTTTSTSTSSTTSTSTPGSSTTTTSVVSTTTSTSTSSTTSTSTPGSSTTTTSTVSTTIPDLCACDVFPFLIGRDAKFNNKADILGNVGVNDPVVGRLRLSKLGLTNDGNVLEANEVVVGPLSVVDDVNANTLNLSPEAVMRGTLGSPTLPIVDPFCPLEPFECGSENILVPPGTGTTTLQPGVYGTLKITNGATVYLEPGEYTFCKLQTGRRAGLRTNGPVVVNVKGSVRIGTASVVASAPGSGPLVLNTLGKSVRLSAEALAHMRLTAPNAKAAFGRRSLINGCFCVDRSKTDKGTTFICLDE